MHLVLQLKDPSGEQEIIENGKQKKKQTKIAVELIAKRKVICIRPTMPQEKKN